jgi:hypothetical protein
MSMMWQKLLARSGAGISFMGTQAAQNGGSSVTTFSHNLTSTWSNGPRSALQQGDLVFVLVGTSATSDLAIAENSGTWAEEFELYANDNSDANFAVYSKVMGSTPDTSVAFTAGASFWATWAYAVSGVNTSNPFEATRTTATGTDIARPDPPAITPSTPGVVALAVGMGAGNNDVAAFTSSDLESFYSDGNNFARFGAGLFPWVSGSINPAQWGGGSTSTLRSWAAGTFAIRPE